MRSKCRCSCVLQFAFRRAVCCVLHRPPSQVIHCTVLCFSSYTTLNRENSKSITFQVHIPSREGLSSNPCKGEGTFAVLCYPLTLSAGHCTLTQTTGEQRGQLHPDSAGHSVAAAADGQPPVDLPLKNQKQDPKTRVLFAPRSFDASSTNL